MSTADHPITPDELMSYLDGELRADRLPIARNHLARCADCRQLVAELTVSNEMAAWQVEDPPVTLRAPQIPIATAEQSARSINRRWRRVLLSPAIAAPAVLVAGAALWFAGSRIMRQPPAGTRMTAAATVQQEAAIPRADRPAARMIQVPREAVAPDAKVIRTAKLTIVAKDFSAVKPAVDRILRDVSGFVGQVNSSETAGASRLLRATLRVPADRLDEALRSLRALGQVIDEAQGGEDVSGQSRDLEARLANARNTEKRLNDVLKNRTGGVSDVLAVEREMARVRQEIEQLDAERAALDGRVSYATITLAVSEERRATLDMDQVSLPARARNALVAGVRDALDSAATAIVWALRTAPPLLLWTAIFWWPARRLVRRTRALARSAGL